MPSSNQICLQRRMYLHPTLGSGRLERINQTLSQLHFKVRYDENPGHAVQSARTESWLLLIGFESEIRCQNPQ